MRDRARTRRRSPRPRARRPPPPATRRRSHPPRAPSWPRQKTGPGLLVRALWFVFIGWWLTAIVSAVAWFAMITIIGLPLGIWLVNRIPTVLTLRPRTSYVYAYTDALGRTVTHETKIDQPPWYIRGLWFIFVGLVAVGRRDDASAGCCAC